MRRAKAEPRAVGGGVGGWKAMHHDFVIDQPARARARAWRPISLMESPHVATEGGLAGER